MMNNSPFSPFPSRCRVGKRDFKRRQSELPSDLIDWDAPEIPELEKERIIYENYIRETNEDHMIEMLINEEILKVATEALVETTAQHYEDELNKERSRVHLLLGQIKMFEENVKELEGELAKNKGLEERVQELEQRNQELEAKDKEYEGELASLLNKKSELEDDIATIKAENEDLVFRNTEITCDLNAAYDNFLQKKTEAEEFKRNWENARNRLAYYKKIAKGNKD